MIRGSNTLAVRRCRKRLLAWWPSRETESWFQLFKFSARAHGKSHDTFVYQIHIIYVYIMYILYIHNVISIYIYIYILIIIYDMLYTIYIYVFFLITWFYSHSMCILSIWLYCMIRILGAKHVPSAVFSTFTGRGRHAEFLVPCATAWGMAGFGWGDSCIVSHNYSSCLKWL